MENVDVFQVQMENNSEIGVHETKGESYNMVEISEAQHLCDNVVISIEKMLNQLPSINGECSIYRVPKQLREMNPKAYDPQLISIGPFHHQRQNKDFRATEQYKLRALMNFLRRIKNDKLEYSLEAEDVMKVTSLKVLVKKAHCWVKEARNCYAEPINMDEEEFVIMMLVDACFIVEFFIQKYNACHLEDRKFDQIQDNVDFSLLCPEIAQDIIYDLIKLENQVPFFLLQHMFHLIPEDSRPVCFIKLTYDALSFGFTYGYQICCVDAPIKPKHLVDFLSFFFVPLLPEMQNKQHEKNSENKNNFLSFFCIHLCCLWRKPDKKNREENSSPPSITELSESGVTIKKAKKAKYLMSISFKNGVLKIPPIHIYDEFELLMRNMVAFEQFPAGNKNMHVMQYVFFLDDLISTEKDVYLLVKAGVIVNNIGGSDKEVSDLFNSFGKFVSVCPRSSHFDHISEALREHCNGRWNKAKASLKHNYFNTPWAFISFFAATLLILLTILQTIFSAISAFPS